MCVYSDDSTQITTFSARTDQKMSGMLDATQIVRNRKKSGRSGLAAVDKSSSKI